MKRKIKALTWLMILGIMLSIFQSAYASAASGNTAEEAMTLSINKEKTDYVQSSASVRWFKVKLNKDGILKLTLKSAKLKQNGMLYLYYGDNTDIGTKNQSVRLEYNESKKTQSVTLKSETSLSKGTYLVCFRTSADTLEEKVKYTLKATLQSKNYDDAEPNTVPDNAQKLTIKDVSKTAVTYKMNVNSGDVNPDIVDRFKISLPSKKAIIVRVKSKGKGTLRVMVYKGDDKKLLNTKESKQYLSPDGKTKELVYVTTKAQSKGKYSVVVLLQDTENCSMDYSISLSYYEPVTSIKASKVTVLKGKKKKIPVKLNSKATEPLTYKSSNKKVATVDADGNVKGIKKGTATITIKSAYTKKTTKCKVTVKDQPVEKITLSATSKTLTKGNSYTLTATVSPDNAVNKAVSYSSSNPAVATVNESGKITAVSAGTATITVSAKDGSNVKATCKVTVKNPVVTEKPPKEEDKKPQDTPQPTVSGSNNVKISGSIVLKASHSGGTWSASNGNVSLSPNGEQCTVTGVSEGMVKVTYTLNGKSAAISIYVKK